MLSFFIFAALAYGGASFAFGAAVDPSKPRWPRILLAAAALLHTATIGAQCVDGFHPLQNVYLAMSGGQTSLGLEAEQGAEVELEQVEARPGGKLPSLPLWQADEASLQANREYIEFLATQHDDPAWK